MFSVAWLCSLSALTCILINSWTSPFFFKRDRTIMDSRKFHPNFILHNQATCGVDIFFLSVGFAFEHNTVDRSSIVARIVEKFACLCATFSSDSWFLKRTFREMTFCIIQNLLKDLTKGLVFVKIRIRLPQIKISANLLFFKSITKTHF